MGIEIYGFMMNKKAMSEVSLRVFLYIQLSLELSKKPTRRLLYQPTSMGKESGPL